MVSFLKNRLKEMEMGRLLIFWFAILSCAQAFGQVVPRVGCWKDTTRTCGLMAAADPTLPPFMPCGTWLCSAPFGQIQCPESEGLVVTDWTIWYHDIDFVPPGTNGRTNVGGIISPWKCGVVFGCNCVGKPVGTACASNATPVRDYHPIEYSTFGPINCFHVGNGTVIPAGEGVGD